MLDNGHGTVHLFSQMHSLLRWSLQNSDPQDGPSSGGGDVSSQQKLDPAIIDMILGKPDAVQLKEDVSVAVDAERSEDDRLAALDHLEMVSLKSLFE
jgi:hypothetical protein